MLSFSDGRFFSRGFFGGGMVVGCAAALAALTAGLNLMVVCAAALAVLSFSLTFTFVIFTFYDHTPYWRGVDPLLVLRLVLGATTGVALIAFIYKASLKLAQFFSVSLLWGMGLTCLALLTYLGLCIVFLSSFTRQR